MLKFNRFPRKAFQLGLMAFAVASGLNPVPCVAQEGFDRGRMEFRSFDPSMKFGGPPGGMMMVPGGGDFRSYGRDSRGDSDRDRDRDRDRRDSGSNYGSSSSSTSASSSSSSRSSSLQKVRVTMELQSTYASYDEDRDGQVGLYEWKKAKRPLAEFRQLDLNGDGFLTPREVERAGSGVMIAASPAPTTAPIAANTNVTTTSTTIPAANPVPATAAVAPVVVSTITAEEQAKIDAAQAKNYFASLDRDRDGKVSAEEMARSTRVRPLFEAAGFNFKEPMPSDQFISNYVEIQKKNKKT